MDILLQKLIDAFGVSGNEKAVRDIILSELKDIQGEIKEDKLGNIIVKLGEGSEKLMLAAHMDEIGLMATYIEDEGFVRVGAIGDFNPKDFLNSYVEFENGIIGKLSSAKDDPEVRDLFIDLGMDNRETVLSKIKEGYTAHFLNRSYEISDNIMAPNLDNRIGIYILLKLIKEVKNYNKEVYFVFTAQKELGNRGARAAAHVIKPDIAIVIDLEPAKDVPGGENNIKLNAGPIISIMNKTLIINHKVKAILEEAAKGSSIKLQYSVSSENNEGGIIHKEINGIETATILVPCRYLHTSTEMVSFNDVKDTISLLKEVL